VEGGGVSEDLRELLREAREWMADPPLSITEKPDSLRNRIDTALAEPAPEPVAWIHPDDLETLHVNEPAEVWSTQQHDIDKDLPILVPLYAIAPPPASPSEARDAARYRWLRDQADGKHIYTITGNYGTTWDAAIDAAIERKGEPEIDTQEGRFEDGRV